MPYVPEIAETQKRATRPLTSELSISELTRFPQMITARNVLVQATSMAIDTAKARALPKLAIAKEPTGAEPSGRQTRALQKWRLKRVDDYVENHLSEKISLSELAAVAGLSRMHFASQFRVATGLRPHEFLLRRRVQRAERLLRESALAIVEIALTVGFQTQAHFTTVFKKFTGCPPHQWRCAKQPQRAAPARAISRAEISLRASQRQLRTRQTASDDRVLPSKGAPSSERALRNSEALFELPHIDEAATMSALTDLHVVPGFDVDDHTLGTDPGDPRYRANASPTSSG
jgi:AraC-like DNA-binding protein